MSKQAKRTIDIVSIKTAVKQGSISFSVHDGYIYCDDIDSGETVIVGKADKHEQIH